MKNLIEELHDVLVEETAHERCPDGSHWNENEKKCMPVGEETKKKVVHAKKLSRVAARETDRAGTRDSMATGHDRAANHFEAASAHAAAYHGRKQAVDALKADGFNELAAAHEKMMDHHKGRSEKHNKSGARARKQGLRDYDS